jgi:metal-responsive CopG/Arc/MetJ family transcriptional regulator
MATLQVRLPQDLLKRIDAYRFQLTMRPTRSQTIRFLLENALSILEEAHGNERRT